MTHSVTAATTAFPTILAVVAACGSSSPAGGLDAQPNADARPAGDANTATDASAASADGAVAEAADGFERPALGPNWMIVYPPTPPNDQVRIIDGSDLGMGPGPQGFFLVNWIGSSFAADQYCEATIPDDVEPGWAHMVYVRWRAADGARYGFAYDNDPLQPNFGDWIFKYDGVPGPETRIIASTPGTQPQPGDRIRIEVEGFTLRGYHNGALVLEATDTDGTRISGGLAGLAARWADGNISTDSDAKVWESWSGGNL